ncbi:MAG: hypothetical protein WCV58_04505 [Patescibacteria group bacterium]
MEQVWSWIVTAYTVKQVAYVIAVLDGLVFYGWYLLFVNEPQDLEWLFVMLVVAIIILICFGLTILWTGFPLLVATCWLSLFTTIFNKIRKKRVGYLPKSS